jgi:hypothetical protein
VFFDANVTTLPPAGAGPFNVTVPVDGVPPTTEPGDTDTPVNTAGVTVSVVLTDVLPIDAAMVGAVELATAVVDIVKVWEDAPAATVTLDGGAAHALLDVRSTRIPPVGAGPFKVTVPVDEVPPNTDVGDTDMVFGTGDVIVKVAVTDVSLVEAVMVTGVDVGTAEVEIVKVAFFSPAATITDAGNVALEELEDRLMKVPPVGAGSPSTTVPVDEPLPRTEAGATVTLASPVGKTVSNAVALMLPEDAVIIACVIADT